MRRLTALLLALLTMLCPALAEDSDWYLETAMGFAGKVGELAGDDAYLEMMTGMDMSCLEPFRTADYTRIVSVYRCKMPDAAGVRVLMKAVAGWDMSGAALETWIAKLPVLPITTHNGNVGMDELAASTVAVYSRTYSMPQDFEPCIYILEVDGAVIAAAFCLTGEDTVTVSAQPLFDGEGAGIEALIEAFTADNIPMEVEKIR